MLATLSIQQLSKHYGRHIALKPLSLEVAAGQVYGLLGPNGAGKTTVLRVLSTLLTPTSGTAQLAGWDIIKQPEQVRQSIGVVNGGMGLYDRLTGREVLQYFAGFYGLKPAEIRVRIGELSQLLDMDALLDRQMREFSTGMKQKIVIARAVIHRPKVLILDEASSGLDVLARRSLMDFVRTYSQEGHLVLYSTHVMDEIEKLCERTAILYEGELIAEDTLDSLKTQTQTQYLEDTFFALVHQYKQQVAENVEAKNHA